MMKAKILKTEEEYRQALARVHELMQAEPGTPEMDDLELFARLVEDYELEHYPIDLPDPVTAIEFRMDQMGLTRKDLVKYIGSQSKVSEVLNRKVPLSLKMIRNLHEGLGIPADILIGKPGEGLAEVPVDWKEYPFSDMVRFGFFPSVGDDLNKAKGVAEELLTTLLALAGKLPQSAVNFRRKGESADQKAMMAWLGRVCQLANEKNLPNYDPTCMTQEVLRGIAKLSVFEDGPRLAVERLEQLGIALVILPHLKKTYLDGACFLSATGKPVIALTLRHDRLDNFWFTLFHELAHLVLHLRSQNSTFLDETDGAERASMSPLEAEADQMAAEWLLPSEVLPGASEPISTKKIQEIASRQGVGLEIVAGRVRWERHDFKLYAGLLKGKKVQHLFWGNQP